MIDMTLAQRDAVERKWQEMDEKTRPPLQRFLDSVNPTFHMDNAVTVFWCGMWLAIETDGYTHS